MEEGKGEQNGNNNTKSGSRDHELLTKRANKTLWLMKCPPGLSFSGPSDDGPMAKVVVSIDPLKKKEDPQVTLEVPTEDSDESNVPKSYSMVMSRDFVPMCLFSETNDGRVAVEGKVLDKFEMEPNIENMGNYGKLCRERSKKSMKKTRQVKVLEDDFGEYVIPKPVVSSSKGSFEGSRRRERMERGEMESKIFKLFERQPIWKTLKQLIDETRQPEAFVREVVRDLCVYTKKGDNKGYELKPEYKQQQQQQKQEEEAPEQQEEGSINKEEPGIPKSG